MSEKIDEDSIDFDAWFERMGFDEQYRKIFAVVWDAALESGKRELDEEWHWLLDGLRSER